MGRFTGILGLLTMLGMAFAFSTNRRAIRIKTVLWGLGLQFAFAVFVIKIEVGRLIFQVSGDLVKKLLDNALAGSSFVFGELGKPSSSMGFYFAFQVLPTIIFIAAFFAVLYRCLSKTPMSLKGGELYLFRNSLFRCSFFLRHSFLLCPRSSVPAPPFSWRPWLCATKSACCRGPQEGAPN